MSGLLPDFDEYVRTLNPALYLPLCSGDTRRQDANAGAANLPTVVDTIDWLKTPDQKFGVVPKDASGCLTIEAADCPETNVTSFTLFVGGWFRDIVVGGPTERLLEKRDAVSLGWNFYLYNTVGRTNIRYSDLGGANLRSGSTYVEGKTSIAAIIDGADVYYYSDGEFVNTKNGAAASASSKQIYIGNGFGGDRPSLTQEISCVVIFPSVLTPQQVSILAASFKQMRFGHIRAREL